ncbi:MAG: DNA repair protein RecO [bacterium]|nr:DNA repair protein RecO [bacterium]
MSAERQFRTNGLILKRRDFGEADRLLTVLTPDHGKIDMIAKGARKPTSTKTGHVELFTRVDLLVHRGRDLDIAAQAEMTEPYLPLREDLGRGAFASYAAELMDRFTTEGEEDLSALFDLLAVTFQRLSDEDDLRLVVRYYELRLLDVVGFRPELTECVFSHETLQPEDQFFSYAEGGAVSPAAAEHASNLVPLSLNALKVLRHFQRSRFEQVRALTVPPALHTELERLMLGYLTYILERRLQSVDFIRRIRA